MDKPMSRPKGARAVTPRIIETPYLDRHEAAAYIRSTPDAVSVYVSQGRLKALRQRGPNGACRKHLFRREDLDAFVQGAAQAGAQG